VTAPDRLHVEARPADRTVRLTIVGSGRPPVNVDMDVEAVRQLAAALLDGLTALDT